MQYLNTNHTLYHAVMKVEKDRNLLSKEAKRAAHYLRVDFEKGGIHLAAGTCMAIFFILGMLIFSLSVTNISVLPHR